MEHVGPAAFTVATPEARLAEVGNPRERLAVQSVRKVVASTVIGTLVADGTLDLEATLADLEIDDAVPPSLTAEERTATVRHLLQSRSGVYHPAAFEDPAMRNRPRRGSAQPGELAVTLDSSLPKGRRLRVRAEVVSAKGTARLFIDNTEGDGAVVATVGDGQTSIGVRWDDEETEVSIADIVIDFDPSAR